VKPSKATVGAAVPLAGWAFCFCEMPLAAATFNPRIFFYAHADEKKLKRSLADALTIFPLLAGRMDARSSSLVLSDAGIPFTTVHLQEEPPEDITEEWIKRLADPRMPMRVGAGKEPIATVQLTFFPSGRAALCFSAAHVVLDGMSAFTVLNTWASLARGEAVPDPVPSTDTSVFLKCAIPTGGSPSEVADLFEQHQKMPMLSWPKQLLSRAIICVVRFALDVLYLRNGPEPRVPLFLSHAQLAAIKAAASPKSADGLNVAGGSNAAGGPNAAGGWVTTQEALAAFLLVQLGTLQRDARQQERAEPGAPPQPSKPGAVRFWRDARPILGLAPDHILGTGVYIQTIDVGDDYLQVPLAQLAARIHEGYHAPGLRDEVENMTSRMNWLHQIGYPVLAVLNTEMSAERFDLLLGLNNQSKVVLPDFGTGASGLEERLLTAAGPNIITPARGGVRIYLRKAVLPKANLEAAVAQIQHAADKL